MKFVCALLSVGMYDSLRDLLALLIPFFQLPKFLFLFQAEIEKFRKFADKVEELHVENNKVAMDLDDAPDEFKGNRHPFRVLNSYRHSGEQNESAVKNLL